MPVTDKDLTLPMSREAETSAVVGSQLRGGSWSAGLCQGHGETIWCLEAGAAHSKIVANPFWSAGGSIPLAV